MKNHLAQTRQLYGPNLGTLTDNLPNMGESLQAACLTLANDCTLARIDELVSRLKTAEQTITRLRLAMIAERTTGHGTG
jgi:hypothetical protein